MIPFIFSFRNVRSKKAMKQIKHNEDYELWTRVLKVGGGHNLPEFLIDYRIHQNQVTRKGNLKMRLVGIWVRVLVAARLL
jgi:hypothetical protein